MVFSRVVSSGFPRVVGIPLAKGRWTTDDEPMPAVMVNETFVRRVFGYDEPLGMRLRFPPSENGASGGIATIVGVVGDLKVARLDAEPDPEILIPYKFSISRRLDVMVKLKSRPASVLPAVRTTVARIDPTQPPYGITTLEDALADSIAP